MPSARTNMILIAALLIGVFASARLAHGFTYLFAGESNGIDLVTHPMGYAGVGSALHIRVGIDNTSVFAHQMRAPTQRAIATWNSLVPTTSNLQANAIAGYDFESTVLHELGHAIGLGHPNLASESGLLGADRNYTRSTDGADNAYDLNPGPDGVIGSHDDLRGDDVNLHWFHKASNDPFNPAHALGTVDATTYSRALVDLPVGDSFATNAERWVSILPRYSAAGTEAVMQQGSVYGETQRTLAADDVAGIKYAMAGLDEIAGTADDYTLNLHFNGLVAPDDTNTDIILGFDNTAATYAATSVQGALVASSNHAVITSAAIAFNTNFDWVFSDAAIPAPAALALGLPALVLVIIRHRRRSRSV